MSRLIRTEGKISATALSKETFLHPETQVLRGFQGVDGTDLLG